jgi:alpha-galactosidase
MSKKVVLYLLACRLTLLLGHAQATQVLWLDDLPIQTYSEGIRPVAAKTNYS